MTKAFGEEFAFQPSPANDGKQGRLGKFRSGRKLPVVFAAVVFLVLAAPAGAFLGARHEDNHWTPLYNGAVHEATQWKSTSAHWRAESLKWQNSSERYHGQLHGLQTKISTSVGD